MILAAGKGERLQPLTFEIPKALLIVAGKTLLEWAIARYNQAGINDIVIAVGWKGSMIEDFVSESNIEVDVVHVPDYERGPLQTLLTAIETIEGDFLLSPVDAVVEPSSMIGIQNDWLEFDTPNDMTLAIGSNVESGTLVEFSEDGLLTGIGNVEPSSKNVGRSAMLLIANTRIRDLCRSALADGKERVAQLLENLIKDGSRVRCFQVSHPWFDIDTLSDLLEANQLLLQRGGFQETRSIFIPSGDSVEVGDSFTLKSDITLGKGTTLHGPVLIASNCEIGEDCKVGPNVTIDSNTIISNSCEVADTVIFGQSKLATQSRVHMSAIYNSHRYNVEV